VFGRDAPPLRPAGALPSPARQPKLLSSLGGTRSVGPIVRRILPLIDLRSERGQQTPFAHAAVGACASVSDPPIPPDAPIELLGPDRTARHGWRGVAVLQLLAIRLATRRGERKNSRGDGWVPRNHPSHARDGAGYGCGMSIVGCGAAHPSSCTVLAMFRGIVDGLRFSRPCVGAVSARGGVKQRRAGGFGGYEGCG
jgi:hypothetical protein